MSDRIEVHYRDRPDPVYLDAAGKPISEAAESDRQEQERLAARREQMGSFMKDLLANTFVAVLPSNADIKLDWNSIPLETGKMITLPCGYSLIQLKADEPGMPFAEFKQRMLAETGVDWKDHFQANVELEADTPLILETP